MERATIVYSTVILSTSIQIHVLWAIKIMEHACITVTIIDDVQQAHYKTKFNYTAKENL